MTNPTDTNQASELYELCKEVYEKTGWEAPETYKAEDGNPENDWQAYDTDYLLEKLPPTIVARGEAFSTATRIAATPKQLIATEADTPLKALLKLALKLKEDGLI